MRVDIPVLKQYAEAVYAATDDYLARLKPEALDDIVALPVELGGSNKKAVNLLLGLLIVHNSNHVGEIAAIKGIRGLPGYPF